jgi:anthranilate synthase component 2
VFRNDKITVEAIREKKPSHIIISPGPGLPKDTGISIEVIKVLGKHIPILGVCLGHQAIAEAFGGKVVQAKELMHGKASEIFVNRECPLFRNFISEKIMGGRYHSHIVENESLPSCLKVTARAESGEIMGLMHEIYPIFGVQFHPESILTPDGKKILSNFLEQKMLTV